MDPNPEEAPVAENRPEPVTDAGKVAGTISGVITALAGLAVVVGLASAEEANALAVAISGVVMAVAALAAVVVPIWKSYQARNAVTPLADPRDEAGNELVPATSLEEGHSPVFGT